MTPTGRSYPYGGGGDPTGSPAAAIMAPPPPQPPQHMAMQRWSPQRPLAGGMAGMQHGLGGDGGALRSPMVVSTRRQQEWHDAFRNFHAQLVPTG